MVVVVSLVEGRTKILGELIGVCYLETKLRCRKVAEALSTVFERSESNVRFLTLNLN